MTQQEFDKIVEENKDFFELLTTMAIELNKEQPELIEEDQEKFMQILLERHKKFNEDFLVKIKSPEGQKIIEEMAENFYNEVNNG